MNDAEVLTLIKKRRSIRKFKDVPIPEKDIMDLVEAGVYAPSGCNTQNQRFTISTRQSDIDYIGTDRLPRIKTCKALIFVWSEMANYPVKNPYLSNLPYWNAAAAIQNILLLSEAKGIGACWIAMDPKMPCMPEIRIGFDVPPSYVIMGLVVLGYADETIDLETDRHVGRLIKRKEIKEYIWKNNS